MEQAGLIMILFWIDAQGTAEAESSETDDSLHVDSAPLTPLSKTGPEAPSLRGDLVQLDLQP